MHTGGGRLRLWYNDPAWGTGHGIASLPREKRGTADRSPWGRERLRWAWHTWSRGGRVGDPLKSLHLARSQGWDAESLGRRGLGSSVLWGPLRGAASEAALAGSGGPVEMVGRKDGTPRGQEGATANSRPQGDGPKVSGWGARLGLRSVTAGAPQLTGARQILADWVSDSEPHVTSWTSFKDVSSLWFKLSPNSHDIKFAVFK